MQLTFLCLLLINKLIKKTAIAFDNYNNTLKEYDSIYAASKDLQINSGIIIYSCKICISLKGDILFVIKIT